MANEVEILWYKKWLLAIFFFFYIPPMHNNKCILQFAVGDSESLIKGSCDKICSRILRKGHQICMLLTCFTYLPCSNAEFIIVKSICLF